MSALNRTTAEYRGTIRLELMRFTIVGDELNETSDALQCRTSHCGTGQMSSDVEYQNMLPSCAIVVDAVRTAGIDEPSIDIVIY